MNVYRGLYFATLAGATGGLLAWAMGLPLTALLKPGAGDSLADALLLLLFGLVMGVVVYLQVDRSVGVRVRPATVGYGLLWGGAGGVLAALAAWGFARTLAPVSPALFRIAVWTIGTSLVAAGIGLRWARSNRARVLHTYVGGLAGGLLGGGAFLLLAPHLPAGVSLAGLLLAGAGTSFGAGIAPVLVRDGQMRFISSGDARAQNKLGKQGKLWDLAAEESYVVGSLGASPQGGAVYQQGADVWLPDSSVAPRHAVLFSREGRYFIARHPDASGSEGIAKYVLRIKGKTVLSSQELRPGDDLVIGRTALRFESRREGE